MTECTCGAIDEFWRTHNPETDSPDGVSHSSDCQLVQQAIYEQEHDL